MSKGRYKKPESVLHLENLKYKHDSSRFGDDPPKWLVRDRFEDRTANGLTRCIVEYIKLSGGQAERINTMGRPIDKRKTFTDVIGRTRTIGSIGWIPSNTTKGSADISATINGKSVKIEVKIGRDRQSEDQIKYQQAIESAGGIYYIAKDFTTFFDWHNETFGRVEV